MSLAEKILKECSTEHLYTEAEMQKALKTEREDIIIMIDDYIDDDRYSSEYLFKAIRSRNKK